MMRFLSSPGWLTCLIVICLPLFSGCSTIPKLWKAPVIEKQVEYITQRLECGPEPTIDSLRLAEYEPIVLPSLSTMGVTPDLLPDWLVEHYDHGWIALSEADWEDVDSNDIDKKRLAGQLQAVIEFYRKCLEGQNSLRNTGMDAQDDAKE